jgi:COMPASS component SWD3
MSGPQPTCVAITPDHRRIAISTGVSWRTGPGEVRFYAGDDGRHLKTCVGHKAGTSAIAFAPDGKTLATASLDRSIRLWDVPAE